MFWERFENLCQLKGMKPNPVGREIGISSGVITNWKNGTIPNGETLIKLSTFLGCSIDYLLGLDDVSNRKEINLDFDGYTDYYVAFIDILGFKEFVDTNAKSVIEHLFDDVKDISEKSSTNFKSNFFTQEMLSKVIFNFISDTIILSIPKRVQYSLNILIFMVNIMISNLLFSYQLIVRGAITDGKFYTSNDVLFGPALNRAAELEHKVSKYPRIVIQKNLLNSYIDTIKNDTKSIDRIERYIIKDNIFNDFNYYILNYSNYCVMRLSKLDNNILAIETINKIIREAESKLKHTEESVRKKWLYFAISFNNELEKYADFINKKISIPLSMNTDFNNKEMLFENSEDIQELIDLYNDLPANKKERVKGYIEGILSETKEKRSASRKGA